MRCIDILVALIASCVIHAVAGVVLVGVIGAGSQEKFVPEFKRGESSVELVLVQPKKTKKLEQKTPVANLDPIVNEPVEEVKEDVEPEQVIDQPEVLQADNGVEAFYFKASLVEPKYPRLAVYRGQEGVVKVKVYLNAAGKVLKAEVVESSGYPLLDRAAVDALNKSTFHPVNGSESLSGGEEIYNFRFKLE